jgi:hypothetical protein
LLFSAQSPPYEHIAVACGLTVITVAAGLSLMGCGFGGVIYGDKTRSVDRPRIIEQDDSTASQVRRISGTPSSEILTIERLRQAWGEPDRIVPAPDNADAERWTYRTNGWRWHGALLILIAVPLPLLVPLGHEHILFTIEHERVVSAVEVRSGPKYGGFCGFPLFQILMLQQWPFVCTAGAVRLTEP